VYVYGRSGDKKTDEMCKALRSAQIPFQMRDFDKDKRYNEPLKRSGYSGGSLHPPVVCLGSKAWWEDSNAPGDEMFSLPFASSVAMELRHELGALSGPETSIPVREGADIDTEIAERFLSMQDAFLKMDDNRDGRITKKELIEKCKQWNIPTSEAQRIIGESDVDHNGTLDFNEFAVRFNSFLPHKAGTKISSPHRPPGKPSGNPRKHH